MLKNSYTNLRKKKITLCPFRHFLLLHDLCLFGLFKVDKEVQNISHAVSNVICNAAQPPRKELSVNAPRLYAHFF